MLEVRNLTIARDGHELIAGLDLQVGQGAVVTLTGASGSGKSTLLNWLVGDLDPAFQAQGELWLDGQRRDGLPVEARGIGILFQDDLLFAHMTVRENLLFAVPAGPRAEREAAVTQALTDLELPGLGSADPATLSGGQRSRVALMRALLARPRALLLDEPFARLDAALRGRMREYVFTTLAARGIPALLVTHDEQDIADPSRVTRWPA